MSRTATEQDLYRRVQSLEESLRQQQQGLLQGAYTPYVFRPCDYAATSDVVVNTTFTSITDVAPGAATLPALGGMRILLWRQTNKAENGIYEVGLDNVIRRASDMADGSVVRGGSQVYVLNGYSSGNRAFFALGTGDKIVGSSSLLFSPPKGTVISFQRLVPNAATWAGASTANNGQVIGGGALSISYTPPVNCDWDIHWIARIDPQTASYNYAYPGIKVTPVDRNGEPSGTHNYALRMQHSQVQTYEPGRTHKTYSLLAGTAYTAQILWYCSAGSWNVQLNPSECWMEATARVSA